MAWLRQRPQPDVRRNPPATRATVCLPAETGTTARPRGDAVPTRCPSTYTTIPPYGWCPCQNWSFSTTIRAVGSSVTRKGTGHTNHRAERHLSTLCGPL
jgi:hypothetical protein